MLNAEEVLRRAVDDALNALAELRQQNGEECVDHKRRKDQRKHNGDRAAEFFTRAGLFLALCELGCEPPIDQTHERIEQKRDDRAGDKRRKDAQDIGHQLEEARQIRKDHDEQNADKNNCQRRDAPLKISAVSAFLHTRPTILSNLFKSTIIRPKVQQS